MAHGNLHNMPLWSAAFYPLSVLVAIAVPVALVLKSRREEVRKLLTAGLLGDAEILAYAVAKNSRYGSSLVVDYQFIPRGASAAVRLQKVLPLNSERFPIGSRVPVRYKARFPFIAVLVPYAAVETPS
jgi:hypothetical protein